MALICSKCNAENADNAYFCGQCHAHIRSSFGAPVAVPSAATLFGSSTAVEHTRFGASATAVAEPEPVAADPIVDVEVAAVVEADALPPETLRVENDSSAVQDEDGTARKFLSVLQQALNEPQAPVAPPPEDDAPVVAVTQGMSIPLRRDEEADAELAALLEREARRREAQVRVPGDTFFGPPVITSAHSNAAGHNTSGLRENAVLPDEARGWTWAGFIPFGAFGFAMGVNKLGLFGLVAVFIPLLGIPVFLIYALVCGVRGRELAWRNRKFISMQQYRTSFETWDKVGKVFAALELFVLLLAWAISAAT